MKIEQEIRAANEAFYLALNAMFVGDMEPMNAVWDHGSEVTQMGPFGGRLTGWESVRSEFQGNADIKLGGKIHCRDLHLYAGTDMGYTVCIEEGENMDENGNPVKVFFRATNIFQRINGEWKLVHHHTDISPDLQEAFGGGQE